MWRTLRRVVGTAAIAAVVLGAAVLIGAYVNVEQRAVRAIIDPHPAVYAERKSPPKATADRNGGRQTAHATPAPQSAAAARMTTVGSGAPADTADDDQPTAHAARHHGRSRHARRLAARHAREAQEQQEFSTQARSTATPQAQPNGQGMAGFFFPYR